MDDTARAGSTTPFARLWSRLRDEVVEGDIASALALVARARRVYRPAAIRRRVRKVDPAGRAFLPSRMWTDVIDSDEPAVQAYAIGRIRWELDADEAALEAFAQSVGTPEGLYAYGDASLWMGHREQGESALRQVVAGGGDHEVFARVLLAEELGLEGMASLEDHRSAAERAVTWFGNGPSARYFRRVLRERARLSRSSCPGTRS